MAAGARFDAPPAARTHRLTLDDGAELHVEQIGPADATLSVVFVHGYALSGRAFVIQVQGLSQRFGASVRLITYDQRGHGLSSAVTPATATIERLGRDLTAVLDDAGAAGAVVLVGHSMGGLTVLAALHQRPELRDRLAGLALLATSCGGLCEATSALPAALRRLAPVVLRGARRGAAWVERGRRLGGDLAWVLTRRYSFAGPAVDPRIVDFAHSILAATRVETLADFYPALMAADLSAVLPTLSALPAPVLIVGAAGDRVVPVEHSRRLARALPAARLVVVERAGHLVQLEAPQVVDAALADLVQAALDGPGRP